MESLHSSPPKAGHEALLSSRTASISLKHKLKAHQAQSKPTSPFRIYLNSLAPSGRASMNALLNQCVTLFKTGACPDSFNWGQLTFERLHFVKTTLSDVGYSLNTINLALAALKGVAKAAFHLGLINGEDFLRINAVKSVKGISVQKGRRVTDEEISRLFNEKGQIESTAKRRRDLAILSVGFGAGLRNFEICALDVSDFDPSLGLLTVRSGKGRKSREIYLSSDACSRLREWIDHRGCGNGPLFTRILKNGRVLTERISTSGLAHALNLLQVSCGIDTFTPHDMRRTFITKLLEEHVDINTVRQLAGHNDISTTTKYDLRGISQQRAASQSIRF